MKKILICCLLSPLLVQAAEIFESSKIVVCGPMDSIVKGLMGEKYKETPIWMGSEDATNTRYSLFVNRTTKTWTIIQYRDNLACIVGTGDGSVTVDIETTKIRTKDF